MKIYFQDGQCYAGELGPFPTPIAAFEAAGAMLAMDDASTVRQYDRDGRMHVKVSNISKANICGYFGREIPGWMNLGLEPDRKYKMLRSPEELQKAVKTFNRLPLLMKHVPASAEKHPKMLTVGTTGSNARYEHPYMKNDLAVWDDEGIGGVEDESQRELSSSYHYRPDMTPGVYEGEAYDGVMRDIVGNHVALVREGRAGDDVIVGDSKPEELQHMTKVLSRKATSARGALIAYLMPKLAMDSKVDVTPIFEGVTSKNFGAKKAGIVAGVTKLTTGLLAQDASISDVAALIDALEKDEVLEGADADPEGMPMSPEQLKQVMAPEAVDEDPDDANKKRREFLSSRLNAEDMKAFDELGVRGGEQTAVDNEVKEEDNMVTKPAMDEAIQAATVATEKRVRENFKGVRAAELAIEPYVGKLALAFDSAPDVYAKAFDMLGVDVKGVDPSAYPAILRAQPKPGAKVAVTPVLAMDAAGAKSFAERYPEAARINHA